MLFTSAVFLLFFLPVALFGWWHPQVRNRPWIRQLFLFLCSLFFYCWWDPKLIWVICATIVFNYFAGWFLLFEMNRSRLRAKYFLAAAITANLAFLAYFKYLAFFAEQVRNVSGIHLSWAERVVLPLGISFFTFQKIAYLVDIYRGQASRSGFIKFGFFVTFFPQLIAGPIVHYREFIGQLSRTIDFSAEKFSAGCVVFLVGFTKKISIADPIGLIVDAGFSHEKHFPALAAWKLALGYTLQLYFDFSGYSDMAIGLGLMFGFALPMNFNSPYQATSLIDFWRRWHITLSNFLRDYLYIPLGGSRHGQLLKYRNLLITMGLGGLWHGAGWTFIAWGFLHGFGLVLNHRWAASSAKAKVQILFGRQAYALLAWASCFIFVVICWVFFRAHSFSQALTLLQSMGGLADAHKELAQLPSGLGSKITFAMLIALAPSVYQYMGAKTHISVPLSPWQKKWKLPQWHPNWRWGAACAFLIWINFLTLWDRVETPPFLYFNF